MQTANCKCFINCFINCFVDCDLYCTCRNNCSNTHRYSTEKYTPPAWHEFIEFCESALAAIATDRIGCCMPCSYFVRNQAPLKIKIRRAVALVSQQYQSIDAHHTQIGKCVYKMKTKKKNAAMRSNVLRMYFKGFLGR